MRNAYLVPGPAVGALTANFSLVPALRAHAFRRSIAAFVSAMMASQVASSIFIVTFPLSAASGAARRRSRTTRNPAKQADKRICAHEMHRDLQLLVFGFLPRTASRCGRHRRLM